MDIRTGGTSLLAAHGAKPLLCCRRVTFRDSEPPVVVRLRWLVRKTMKSLAGIAQSASRQQVGSGEESDHGSAGSVHDDAVDVDGLRAYSRRDLDAHLGVDGDYPNATKWVDCGVGWPPGQRKEVRIRHFASCRGCAGGSSWGAAKHPRDPPAIVGRLCRRRCATCWCCLRWAEFSGMAVIIRRRGRSADGAVGNGPQTCSRVYLQCAIVRRRGAQATGRHLYTR